MKEENIDLEVDAYLEEKAFRPKKETITIHFTSGKMEEWDRRKLMGYVKGRVGESHFDDIVDFIIFQIRSKNKREKLKTLKEIDRCPDCKAFFCGDRKKGVDFVSLKEEATKWIKRLDARAMDFSLATDWIKHFFNITEGDLE